MKRGKRLIFTRTSNVAMGVTLCALVLFIVTFAFVYLQSGAQLKEMLVEKSQTYIKRGAQEIGNHFSANFNLISSAQTLDGFDELALRRDGVKQPIDYASLYLLQDRLSSFFIPSDYFYEMAFFFDAEQSFVCANGFSTADFRSDYEKGLFQAGDLSYDEFYECMHRYANAYNARMLTPVIPFRYLYGGNTRGCQTALYIRKLTTSLVQTPVYALLFINMEKLQSYLSAGSYTSSLFGVYNTRDFTYAVDAPPDIRALGKGRAYDAQAERTYLRAAIPNLDLTTVFAIEDETVWAQIHQFSVLLDVLLLIFLIIALLLFVAINSRLLMPLQRIANKLKGGHTSARTRALPVLDSIEHGMNALLDQNLALHYNLANLQPMIRNNLLFRLLEHQSLTEAEGKLLCESCGFRLEQTFRCVIVGQRNGGEYRTEENDAVVALIQKALPDAALQSIDACRYAAVFAERPERDLPVLTEALSLLLQALHQLPGKAPFAIGVGYRHEGLMEAHLSYREAYTAYNDAVMWKSEQVIFGVDSGTEALPYTLSYDALEKLYNLLLKGESEQAAEHLDKLVAENFAPDSPSRHNRVICHQFYRDVYGVLVRLSSQQDLLPIVDAISSEVSGQPFERKIAQLRTAFFDIANIVMSKKQATAFELVQDMQAYIMSHASDPSVSLTAVADQFGMSESNMSKFFKSKMGVNFSAYLENLRLGAAEQLLMQTNQSVRSVAEAVGYVTPATFYKAFKRKHGITPSEWVMQIKDI